MKDLFAARQPLALSRAPEGVDGWFLAKSLTPAAGRTLLHVARDDARMARLAELVRFFDQRPEVLMLPAWDCLPYDRVGPHRDIVSRRIDTLSRLLQPAPPAGRLVITTVNAFLQRVPPRSLFEGRVLNLKPGSRCAPEELIAFLRENGYFRVDTVGEPGEYALRGGIIDVFASGQELPVRLDFFGDELEQLRSFDPLSQRSSGALPELVLRPVNELLLDEESIARFRSGYREAFGVSGLADPLYEAVSEGRPQQGMEHWLPLFHDHLERVLDYCPDDTAITFDPRAEEVRAARLEAIRDFYEARRAVAAADPKGQEEGVYHPLPPKALYLEESEWNALLENRARGYFHEFSAPETSRQEVLDLGGEPGPSFADARIEGVAALYKALEDHCQDKERAKQSLVIVSASEGARERFRGLLTEHLSRPIVTIESWEEAKALPPGTIGLILLDAERGFTIDGVSFVSEQDILGQRLGRASKSKRRSENFLSEVSSISEGDIVVHVDHGIGRYDGLLTIDVGGAPHDCLKVVYHGGDRLFVPVENIEVLSRYGSDSSSVELDRLGQGQWQARRAQVRARLKMIAEQLMKIAAQRELRSLPPIEQPAGLYEEFCARFPYPETEDQERAISQVIDDLSSGRPMDRLVCGDVGFGKTEVALRAAFLVALSGQQVALIVPTTLLARQHYATFKERFAGMPVRIGMLSRLVGAKDSKLVKEELSKGTLDIVIGTHTLLGEGVKAKRLGMVIVDEEQHFGVKQKEKLKQLRADVHVLTLSATPIPRTLQMAMSGLREMSLIATPPVDRLAVRTFVLPYDPIVVREAILRELHRGGQSFYVCPRLEDLPLLEQRLKDLVPEVKVGIAHGRLTPTELEEVMTGFYERRFDVLLSTNIVESGLDIPTANTLIIHRADMFGLSQLYQLRGRIGRGKIRGYAYLTLPPGRLLSSTAQRRLHVMQTLDHLGAGFTLASHDLDIRGAGNLLGEEQSGHIREVGVELYQQMLEEAVATAKGEAETSALPDAWSPQLNLGTSVLIPEAYVADLDVRLGLYRRLSQLEDRQEIEAFAAELIDRFGPLPEEVENLLDVMTIKQLCRRACVEKVDSGPKGLVIAFHNDSFPNPGALVSLIQQQVGKVQLRPDHRLVYRRSWTSSRDRLKGVRLLLNDLAEMAQAA